MHPWKNLAFGSAIADRIVDDANQSWTDAQLQNAKAKWREMVLNLNNAVDERNNVIEAIKAMPSGDAKSNAIAQFNEAEGLFMTAYRQAQPLFSKFADMLGDELPEAKDANFGFLPLAGWAIVAASLATIAYISTTAYNSYLRYEAIRQNPEVAKYDTGGPSLLSSLGDGAKWAILAVGGALALTIVLNSRKRA